MSEVEHMRGRYLLLLIILAVMCSCARSAEVNRAQRYLLAPARDADARGD